MRERGGQQASRLGRGKRFFLLFVGKRLPPSHAAMPEKSEPEAETFLLAVMGATVLVLVVVLYAWLRGRV
ncbi:hypothetical protein [Granulicella sp. dw_53]|uniref:hypothetical protein n=1 Tax=Granulicella sp. dw_53 TaxID=2719792 RepID=UPI001BD24E4E|nr:hypothetical protein [Granulicella sp. dw_53]